MTTERRIIVVRQGDIFLRDLGGFPSPMLLDLCNDGRAHEAWRNGEQWRARDDAYDAKHKPADVPYEMVIAGGNPRFNGDTY